VKSTPPEAPGNEITERVAGPFDGSLIASISYVLELVT
jgi:hypothetical protein